MAIIFAINGFSQGEITIGSGTSTTSYVPMHCNYDYSYTQTIYNSSEIMGGTISQIAYYMTSTSARTEDIVIYAGNTTKTAFVSNTDFEALANLTQVFSGSVTFNQGWNYITFTTPFLYNGTDNLIIAVDKNTDSWSSRSWQSHSSSFTSCLYYYQDGTDIDPNAPAASNKDFSSSRPNTRFVITPTDPGFCFAPSNLAYSNVLTNQATITWDANLNVASYLIEYKTSSQEWSDATLIPGISGNTHVITNLNANTQYNIRVTPECTSALSSIISLRTACETITQFPWIEGFESDWVSPVSPGDKPAPNCWIVVNKGGTTSSDYYASTDFWWKYTSSTSSHSGSGHASCYTDYGINNHNDWLITPQIALTGNERLRFWAMRSSSTTTEPDEISVFISDENTILDTTGMGQNGNLTGFTQIFNQLLPVADWQLYEINLSQYTGVRYIAFVRQGTPDGYNLRLDDVEVSTIPNCFPPTEIAMSNITSDQAELNFTPAEITGPSWNVMLKNLSTNATVTEPIYSLPHTFYNLTPNTNYSVSIITDCGDGTFSDPTLPVTFRTQCVPVTVPFLEDFSTSVIVEPTCWTRMNGLLADTSVLTPMTSGWIHSTSLDNAMRVNIYGTGVKYWLISPTIDLGLTGSLYQLDFDVVYSDLTTGLGDPTHSDDDIFAVVISPDNGATWSKANARIWYASPDSTYSLTSFSPTSTHISLKLEDENMIPYSGNIKIGLYGESTVALTGADNYLFVDNFAVDLAPMCPAVFNTTASVDNFSTIRVNFATDNAEPGTGWDIAYAETDPTSFDPNAATIVSVNDATELPYIITGLNAGSTYSIAVRQNCGGDWSPAISATIPNLENAVTLPYIQDFEDLNNVAEWTLSNPDTNKWYISNAVSYPDNSGNSLFISDSLGATNEYTNNVISYAYASTIVDFGTGAAEYNLSFDWRARGESSSYDYFKVFLLPIDQAIPTTGWPVGQALGTFNQQNTWQHANIILPASEYENTVKKLVFIWWNDGSTGTNPPAAVDNIQILPMTCATPSNLVVSLVDQTSATLSWNENGTSTSWLVEYSVNGINWTSELASTNTDFVLSNLNPSSTYQVRVYSLCSSIDTSSFVSNVFQTECGVISQFPWLEGFDEAFIGTTASNSLTAAPRCWLNYNGGYTSTTYVWKRGTTASNIYAGAGYAYMDGYGSTTSATYTNNDWLITPVLQLTGNERLNFWVKKEGATYTPDLAIYVLDMNNGDVNATDSISNFTLLANIPNNTISTTYQHQEVDLSSLNGQYRIAFVRLQPSQYDIYVDEVKVSALPNCRRVSDVALSNVSHEEATITWTPGQETDASWNIYLTQGSSTITIPATQIPTTITNLLPNTDYSFVVKTDCGTEESDPSIPISFTTSCTPISVPFLEEFNTSPLTNDCWKQHNGLLADTVAFTSNSSSWTYNTTNPAASPITSMRLNIYGTSMKSWLITPTIDLGNTSNLYQLEFDVTNTDDLQMLIPGVLTGVDDKFAVVISTDNGLTWTSANAHIWSNETGATRVYNDLMSTTPIHIIIPLQDENLIPYQGLIKVGFYGESTVSNADNYLNIDNVAINEWTDCQRPTGLAVNGVSFDEATIRFTEQGTASSWEYSLGIVIDGIDNDPDAGTIISIFDNPYTIQGLTPSTDYYIAVRSDCMSPWSDIVTFRTTPLPVTSFPYLATFDEYDLESSNWTSISNSVNKWVVGDATSSTLGDIIDSYSAYISFNDGDSNSATTATTRAYFYRDFDFGSTPTTYDLSFDWKCLGTYTSSTNTVSSGIMVIPCETTDSINLGGLPLNQNQRVLMVHSQTDWQNASTQLDNMSGLKRIIFFTWGYSAANRYNPAAIDNISLTETTCARPTDVTISDINTTSALISWNGSAGNYIVTYRAAGDAISTYLASSTNTASLSNLLPGTSYSVWIKSICGSDTTINSVSLSFRTPCYDNAISTFPWIEGFESGLSCWTQDYTVGTIDWTNEDNYDSSTPAHGGQKLAYFSDNSFSGYTTKLVSPLLDISGLATPYVSFWHLQKAWGSDQDELKVFYRASADSAWTQLAYYTSNISSWQLDSVALPSASSTYQIAFEGIQNYGYGVGLDDITVYDPNGSSCAAPTDLVVNALNTSASITWTPIGTETDWQVRIGETADPIDVTSASYPMSDLTPNTSYTVYVRANCGGTYSNWVSYTFTTLANVPTTVVTNAATSVTQITATLNGIITAGTEAITAQGFEWKEVSATDWTMVSVAGTTISYNLTGLTANTAYEFRAFATIASGQIYGSTESFNTLPEGVTSPTVVTNAATSVAQTTATLNGTINIGTEAITAQGFEWKEVSAASWTTVTATGTTITHNLTGLIANTAYEFRAFATTASGTINGATLSFTTLAAIPPTVVTNTATTIGAVTATLNGTITVGNESITAQGFEWKESIASTWTSVNVSGSTISYILTGLTPNTNYDFRAFATTASSTVNGSTLSFTTNQLLPPTVTTTDVDVNNTAKTATFQGSTEQGTESIIARGFEYKFDTTSWENAIDLTATGSTNITATATGLIVANYNVRAYAETNSGRTYGDVLDFEITSSITDINKDNLNVNLYPNPASNNTNLSIKGINGKVKISITDVQGRIISTLERESSNGEVNHSINLEAYAKGVYYIRIQSSNSIKTQKLIVQ